MLPAAARRQLMNDFHQPVQRAFRAAAVQDMSDATMLLLDLRDQHARKMAVEVTDLETVRNIVESAEEHKSAPVLIAYAPSKRAADIMRGISQKAERKFAARLPANRFRIVVVGSGGITWGIGSTNVDGPTGRVVG